MKGMKGKLLKKIKSIRPVGNLKLQDRILQVNASDGYVDSYKNNSILQVQNQLICEETQEKKINKSSMTVQEPDIIDVSDLMRDLEDEEMDFDEDIDDKENIRPPMAAKALVNFKHNSENSTKTEHELRQRRTSEASESDPETRTQTPLSEIDVSSFRRPDLNSCSLFDPKLLAAFQQAVIEYIKMSEAERKARTEKEKLDDNEEEPPPAKARRVVNEDEEDEPLLDFAEICPPGGSESVILYSTTLRGIRKTFDNCNSIRFLLESFRVVFYERDISMHSEYREELWTILDCRKTVPPRLFVKGRYVGGAEEVLCLHEQGKLKRLFEGVPLDRTNGSCEGCGGVRFVVCFNCHGSHKVIGEDGQSNKCPKCNENGLIVCPLCC
ncbi:hypothetical protein FNV43_RR25520 [Rhamnella rubrinervis]|uniref:Glutaredoxin domain-containing protein n=1 Tax=Rhamnella rubrinervis TaxID=2594499 RepID=A0A8K0DNH9_9ROSA|nr:hypothetical protein FNV43_RR25520 [Rhamnella rubrinervis]